MVLLKDHFGCKKNIKCHPFKKLGGSQGIDLVPNKKNLNKGKIKWIIKMFL